MHFFFLHTYTCCEIHTVVCTLAGFRSGAIFIDFMSLKSIFRIFLYYKLKMFRRKKNFSAFSQSSTVLQTDVFSCAIFDNFLMQRINFTELKSKTPPHPVINCGQFVSLSLKSAAY